MNDNFIIAVVGPTASGKTELAIKLAEKYSGEIISCDSMQIYKGMDIGTAKPTEAEREACRHHLIDFVEPGSEFSVSDYVTLAKKETEKLFSAGKTPIFAGGTGLYIRSFLYGVNFDEDSRDDDLRHQLMAECESGKSEELYTKLNALDPKATLKIHPNNYIRLVRALEYCLVTGKRFSLQSLMKEPNYPYVMIAISYRSRETLYNRINRRVDIMFEKGLLEEAEVFYKAHPHGTAVQAIGYKELFPYFEGQISLDEAKEKIKQETRRYAKRQLTWFRREKKVHWIYSDDYNNTDDIAEAAAAAIEAERKQH